MQQNTDLLIKLIKPCQVLRAADLAPPRMTLEGVPLEDVGPPWLALADLLINEPRKELVGVTYALPSNAWGLAANILSTFDPSATSLDIISAQELRPPYQREDMEMHYFGIRFSSIPATDVLVAQLTQDRWYRRSDSLNTGNVNSFVAYGIDDIEDVLNQFDLKLAPRDAR